MGSLLPPNASPMERALDAAIGAQFPLPSDLVSAMWSADRCPAEQLGFLAYQLSIDLWDDDWPELKKRQVCRDAFKLHRLKTTLAGIKAHVALTGAEVVQAVRPPGKLFLMKGMSADEREAWLRTLPQIRLYPYDHPSVAPGETFLAPRRAFAGNIFLRPSRGPIVMGTRATFYDRGSETEIPFSRPDAETVRMILPTTGGAFLERAWSGAFYPRTSAAAGNTYTVRLSGDLGGFAIANSLEPVSIEPTRIHEPSSSARAVAFLGNMLGKRYACPSRAPRLAYDRICLVAPGRVESRRFGNFFLKAARLGSPPFQAELRVNVPMARTPLRWRRFFGSGFLMATDFTGSRMAARAIDVSKAARDTILMDTALMKPVTFSDGRKFGSFKFGEIRKAA